jgi:CO/xanthine dehydrogenase Mo-binding subunit
MFRLDLPSDVESGLAAQSTYDHPLTTVPSADRSDLGIFYPFVGHAWHIAVVEVDVETGGLTFLHYAAVHDAGTIVNPKTLNGQIIGGTIQGLGTALYEEYVYDDEGRVLNETFEHYHLPSSMDVPTMVIDHQETPSPYTPYGIKGAGEGGRMLTPAVLSAAIEDALEPYGARITSLPITAENIVAWASGDAERPEHDRGQDETVRERPASSEDVAPEPDTARAGDEPPERFTRDSRPETESGPLHED